MPLWHIWRQSAPAPTTSTRRVWVPSFPILNGKFWPPCFPGSLRPGRPQQLPIRGGRSQILQASFLGSLAAVGPEEPKRTTSSQEFSQKVLFLHTRFWLTLEPQENHKLERHSPSRLLSNNWNYHCHSTAEWKREPEEPFHSLAQQISNGPYWAQGTALASGGDPMSTYTRMFTLHEGDITWC